MKYLVLFSLLFFSIFTYGNTTPDLSEVFNHNTRIASQEITGRINASRECYCNGLPANTPIFGLFHKTRWGVSVLKAFSISDGTSKDKCLALIKQLQEIDVCN